MSLTPDLVSLAELMKIVIEHLSKNFNPSSLCFRFLEILARACRKHIFGNLIVGSPTSNSSAI